MMTRTIYGNADNCIHARGNTLMWKFYMCSTEVKLSMLRTFCRWSTLYTAQLWWNYTIASIHNLHVTYNNVFYREHSWFKQYAKYSAGIGCHIHNCCTNHLFYADDLCVIAPSPSGLQCLLNICEKSGVENDVEYNPITTWLSSEMSRYPYELKQDCICQSRKIFRCDSLQWPERRRYFEIST